MDTSWPMASGLRVPNAKNLVGSGSMLPLKKFEIWNTEMAFSPPPIPTHTHTHTHRLWQLHCRVFHSQCTLHPPPPPPPRQSRLPQQGSQEQPIPRVTAIPRGYENCWKTIHREGGWSPGLAVQLGNGKGRVQTGVSTVSLWEQVENTRPLYVNLIYSFVPLISSFVERGVQTMVARSGREYSTLAGPSTVRFEVRIHDSCTCVVLMVLSPGRLARVNALALSCSPRPLPSTLTGKLSTLLSFGSGFNAALGRDSEIRFSRGRFPLPCPSGSITGVSSGFLEAWISTK